MEILLALLVLLSLVLHNDKVKAFVTKSKNKVDDKALPAATKVVDAAKDALQD